MSSQVAHQQYRGSGKGTRLPGAAWCRSNWWLGASLILLIAITLIGHGSPGGGLGRPNDEGSAHPPRESIGSAGPYHDPLALIGPRSISIAAGVHDSRQRAATAVAPTATALSVRDPAAGAGLRIVASRPVLLTVRGLFDVRAPPRTLV